MPPKPDRSVVDSVASTEDSYSKEKAMSDKLIRVHDPNDVESNFRTLDQLPNTSVHVPGAFRQVPEAVSHAPLLVPKMPKTALQSRRFLLHPPRAEFLVPESTAERRVNASAQEYTFVHASVAHPACFFFFSF